MADLRVLPHRSSTARIVKVMTAYIFCQPLLDVLNGAALNRGAAVTAGIVIRSMFMLLAVFFVIFFSHFPGKALWMMYLGVVLAYLVLFMAHLSSVDGLQLCISNLHNTARSFYPTVMLALFCALYRQHGYLPTTKTLAWIGAIYATVILASIVTGTSFVTYTASGYGFRGWFAATNEVGCIIGLTGPFTIYHCLNALGSLHRKYWWRGVIAVWCMAAVSISASFLGTKIVFLLIAVYSLLVLIWQAAALKRAPSRNRAIQTTAIGGMLLLTLLIYHVSPLRGYFNNVYLELIRHNSELELVTWSPELEAAGKGTWMWMLIQSNEVVRLIDQILSRRLLYAAPAIQVYTDGGIAAKLLGIGYADTPVYGRAIHFSLELDPLSTLLRHGIAGFFIIYVPYITFIMYTVTQFFRNTAQKLSDLCYCTALYSTLACFATSVVTGHILTSTGVSIFMLAAAVLLWDQMRQFSLSPKK